LGADAPCARIRNRIDGCHKKIHDRNLCQPMPRANNDDELDQPAKVFNDTLARLDDSFNRIREFNLACFT
jgi:hypothetical protein